MAKRNNILFSRVRQEANRLDRRLKAKSNAQQVRDTIDDMTTKKNVIKAPKPIVMADTSSTKAELKKNMYTAPKTLIGSKASGQVGRIARTLNTNNVISSAANRAMVANRRLSQINEANKTDNNRTSRAVAFGVTPDAYVPDVVTPERQKQRTELGLDVAGANEIQDFYKAHPMLAGFSERYAMETPEQISQREYGHDALDAETMSGIRESGKFRAGGLLADLTQYATFAPAYGFLPNPASGARSVAGAIIRRAGQETAINTPMNLAIAIKDSDSIDDVIKNFGINQTLDFALGGLLNAPGIYRDIHLNRAVDLNRRAARTADPATRRALQEEAVDELNRVGWKRIKSVLGELSDEQASALVGTDKITRENEFLNSQIRNARNARILEETQAPYLADDVSVIRSPSYTPAREFTEETGGEGSRNLVRAWRSKDAIKRVKSGRWEVPGSDLRIVKAPGKDGGKPRYAVIRGNNRIVGRYDSLPKAKTAARDVYTNEYNYAGEFIGDRPASSWYNDVGGLDNGTENITRSAEPAGVRAGDGAVPEVAPGVPNEVRPTPDSAYVERGADIAGDGGTQGFVPLSREQRAFLDNSGYTNAELRGADYASFSDALDAAKASNPHGGYVDPKTVEDLQRSGAKVYMSPDGSVGVAVTRDGDIVGVFNSGSNPARRGSVTDMLLTARANGGMKLDCYGRRLVNKYEQAGFVPVAKVKFNAEYVSDPVLLREQPDVYVMMKSADDMDAVVAKTINDEHHLSTQEELDALPEFDYDGALAYRDRLLAEQEGLPYEPTPEPVPEAPLASGEARAAETNAIEEARAADAIIEPNTATIDDGAEALTGVTEHQQAAYLRWRDHPEAQMAKLQKAVEGLKWNRLPKGYDSLQLFFADAEGGIARYGGMQADIRRALKSVGYRENQLDEFIAKEIDEIPKDIPYYDDVVRYVEAVKNESEVIEAAAKVASNMGSGFRQYQELLRGTWQGQMEMVNRQIKDIEKRYAKVLRSKYAKEFDARISKLKADLEVAKSAGDDSAAERIAGELREARKESPRAYYKRAKELEKELGIAQEAGDTEAVERLTREIADARKKSGIFLERLDQNSDLTAMIKAAKASNDSEKMAEAMHEISLWIWDQVPASAMEKANAWRMTAMLMNPRTHARNLMGNMLFRPAIALKDYLGIALERGAIAAGKLDREAATKATASRFTEKGRYLRKEARKVWDANIHSIRGESKYYENVRVGLANRPMAELEKVNGKYETKGGLMTAGRKNETGFKRGFHRALDKINAANSSALDFEDVIFMRSKFVDSYAKICNARGLDPAKMTAEQVNDAMEAAAEEAMRSTYRDSSALAKFLNKHRRVDPSASNVKKTIAWALDTTMPFTKTPINIVRRAGDYSPVGVLQGANRLHKAFEAHDSKAVAAALDRLSSGIVGSTGYVLLGAFLGSTGIVNGQLKDGNEGYYQQDLGYQNYALNIGGDDGWSYTLDWAAPASMPFFIGVELGTLLADDGLSVDSLVDVMTHAVNPLLDLSVFQGPANLLESMSGAENKAEALVRGGLSTGLNYLGQFKPTLSGQIARTIDPVRRDTASDKEGKTARSIDRWWKKQLASIPGLSTTLEPYQTVWGEEERGSDNPAIRAFNNMLNPGYVKKKNISDVDKEILRANEANPSDKSLPSKLNGNKVGLDGKDISLTSKEVALYNRTKGNTSRQNLSQLIKTDEYRKATEDEKRRMRENVMDDAGLDGKHKALVEHGEDPYKVYADDLEGRKKDNMMKAKEAGFEAEDWYNILKGNPWDTNDNGNTSNAEAITWLNGLDLTSAQKALLFDTIKANKKTANPYSGGATTATASSSRRGGSRRGRSGGSSKKGKSAKTPTIKAAKAIDMSKVVRASSGLSKSQKKALLKLIQKRIEV